MNVDEELNAKTGLKLDLMGEQRNRRARELRFQSKRQNEFVRNVIENPSKDIKYILLN